MQSSNFNEALIQVYIRHTKRLTSTFAKPEGSVEGATQFLDKNIYVRYCQPFDFRFLQGGKHALQGCLYDTSSCIGCHRLTHHRLLGGICSGFGLPSPS